MKLNEALAKLAPTKADGFITRAGGPTVRNAVGISEQALHRYVIANVPVEGFDASKDDIAADDWSLGSYASEAKAIEDAKAKAIEDATAKAKGSRKE
jgi:hypothetical protein